MGLVRSVISAVDRPGGRWALSLASSIVTNLYGDPLAVRYAHGHWYCTSNGMTLPWGPKFNLYDYDLRTLPSRIRHYLKETQDCWFYRYSPKAGDVIVDVGAEMGTDAVTFSRRVGSSGRVIAIEAQPDTFEILLRTCTANELGNVIPVHMAVADKRGEVMISSDAGVQANFLGNDGVPVPADTLDHILADVPRIDLLKMNIEGAEQLAIRGMDRTIEKTEYAAIACHDFVADETGNEWFRTIDRVTEYLKAKGFIVTRREDDERVYARYHPHAHRPRRASTA